VNAGMDCLAEIEKIYFNTTEDSQQVPNMVIYHTHNLTAPAMEIEFRYLSDLHLRVSLENEYGRNFQLKVISDKSVDSKYEGIIDVALTDFYVIVCDNMTTVGIKIFASKCIKQVLSFPLSSTAPSKA
jgi:phosphoserine aminotransferase